MKCAFDRRRTLGPRAYEPKALNARHHEILRLSLLGLSHVEIAKKLSCTPATVSNAVNSGLGRAQSGVLSAAADYNAIQVAKSIRELAPGAIKAIGELIESEDVPSAVRLRAAVDVLDRAGFAAPKNVNVSSTSVHLTGDDLEHLKREALARAASAGVVIDVSQQAD